MKVGILTFHYAHNYGAVLQAFALLSKLKELGYDAYIINRRPDCSNMLRWIYWHISYKHVWGWLKFDACVRTLLQPQTARYDTQPSFQQHFPDNHFDAVIVGSDQVWRWNWRMIGLNYFLDFVTEKSVRKIAYAASFGVPEWNSDPIDTSEVKKLLKDFHTVSIREKEGINICKDVFDIDARLVLDPTLLYDRTFYEKKIQLIGGSESNKVVSVMLSQSQLSVEQMHWAKNRGLQHTELYTTFYECKKLFRNTDYHWQHVTPQQWLQEIYCARYVITNSFHATVFCILFEKQFVSLKYAGGGIGRIETLLNCVGLESRLIHGMNEVDAIIDQPIDYTSVHENLGKMRKESLKFLCDALK